MSKYATASAVLATTLAALVVAPSFVVRADDEWTYPPAASIDAIRASLAKAPKEHPRLFVDGAGLKALRESLRSDPFRRVLADAVIRQADALLELPPVERKQQGRRLLDQSRRCLKRTIALSMAYHLTLDAKYAQRCEKEMLAAAAFRDWNPSHFLDVAEMTAALAIGYDWLYHLLAEDSRATIRTAIVRKGVSLPFETRHKRWVRASNNWGQVCHGGLTAGALAVLEHEPELAAKTIDNALRNVTRSIAAFAPKGGYPEGPGYWSYGTTYNVLLIAVLESSVNTDFGLSRAPGFALTGQYVSVACGPSGQFFNYADGGAGRAVLPALFWFAARYERPDWLLGEHDRMRRRAAQIDARHARSSSDRFLPLTLLWAAPGGEPDLDDDGDAKIRMPLHWLSEGETPVTMHRTSWTDPKAVFVGVKAGSPSASHGQMDIGSFVLDADGVRWALDLGAEGYHGIESRGMNLWSRSQGSDRWKIFRQQNHGHNTLVIDDRLQLAKGKGTIAGFSDDPDFAFTIVDMSPVYVGQAKSVRRGVALLPSGVVLVRDELSGLKPGNRVRWGMITKGVPQKSRASDGARRVALRQGDATVSLVLRSADAASRWEVIDTATPRKEWDSPNRGTRMVAFYATAPQSGELDFSVVIRPGSRGAKGEATLAEAVPLAGWKER